ncbi:MAG: rhamnogalacturonan acetylesterase [Acidobacteriota bacterium]|nr:rhamnogalacturonan acetylesterase [Acidobacteriota bacterium]
MHSSRRILILTCWIMALMLPSSIATAQQIGANAKLPTLFLIGDSTVKNGSGDGANKQWGWGEPVVSYFDSSKITVLNRARGGRGSRTFLTEGLWEQVLSVMKPGDFVLMQFGHNDGGAINDTSRARGSIKGTGEETEEIDNLLTKKHEVVHSFGWYLRKYVADTKANGATPIICSPVPRKIWKDGRITRDQYGRWAEEVAKAEKVAFIDLNDIIARQYEAMGGEKVEPLFADEHTHTSLAGAELNASSVVAGLKALKPNPLAPYFSAKAEAVKAASGSTGRVSYKFDFSDRRAASAEWKQILPTTIYSKETGYGFEPGVEVVGVNYGGSDSKNTQALVSDKPFFFSVALPEGNYSVTIGFGRTTEATRMAVKAELRRLMVENIEIPRATFEKRTFIVNVRRPQIEEGGEVRLKDREKTSEWWAWDEKLTLEFNGSHPAISSIEIAQVNVPTIYLLGDSTVCDQPLEPYNSWGQMLTRFFTPDVAIANHAESGESLRSSLGARRLDKVLSLIKQGDYLFLQFGHNDMKEKGEGVGAFTTYKTDLKKFVTEARKRGAMPVLVTSMHRRTFDAGGKITNSLGEYPEAVRQVAKEENVALIDLNVMSKALYEALGPQESGVLFKEGDGTHHSNYGSYQLAKCIVEAIKANKLGIAKFLVKDVLAFDPNKPDPFDGFNVPASPRNTNVKPLGN